MPTVSCRGDQVNPQWLKDGNRFWYRNKTSNGAEFVLVNPASASRTLLFDHVKLAQAMTSASDTGVRRQQAPVPDLQVREGRRQRERDRVQRGPQALQLQHPDVSLRRWRHVAERCAVREVADKKLEAFISKNNLWVRNAETHKDSVQLTTDGVEYYSYGTTMPRPSQLQRPQPVRPQLRWSPDSKKIAVMRADERGVEHMHYISYTPQRPKHYSQPYALPGDTQCRIRTSTSSTSRQVERRGEDRAAPQSALHRRLGGLGVGANSNALKCRSTRGLEERVSRRRRRVDG
jgi:hypothetical protein